MNNKETIIMGGGAVTKKAAIDWKTALQKTHSPASVNAMVMAANGFFGLCQEKYINLIFFLT